MNPYRIVGLVGLTLGLVVFAWPRPGHAGDPKATLSVEAFESLVTQDAKLIQELLAKGELDKKTARKVKGAAFLIAVGAQTIGKGAKNEKEMATLRDTALKVVNAVKTDKLDDAKKAAAELTAKPKADPAAKVGPVALDKVLDFDDIMHVFSTERLGGFGIEKELGELAESKDAIAAPQLDKLANYAYKAALIGVASDAFAKAMDEGDQKTAKNWLLFNEQLRHQAFGLAEAARAKNQVGVRKGVDGLSASCVKCHDVFR